MSEFGARVYQRDGSIQVIQTIKSGPTKESRYVCDRSEGKNKERFVRDDDEAALAQAIKDALAGKLIA